MNYNENSKLYRLGLDVKYIVIKAYKTLISIIDFIIYVIPWFLSLISVVFALIFGVLHLGTSPIISLCYFCSTFVLIKINKELGEGVVLKYGAKYR